MEKWMFGIGEKGKMDGKKMHMGLIIFSSLEKIHMSPNFKNTFVYLRWIN